MPACSYGAAHQHKTGLPLSPYFSALKMRWLLDNAPPPAGGAADLRLGTVDSWLMSRLLAGAPYLTDCTNASRTLLMDLAAADYDDELLAVFGLERRWLPAAIHGSCGDFGVFGAGSAAAGIRLAAVLGDQHAALLGHGCLAADTCKLTYGTGCFLLRNVGTAVPAHVPGVVRTVAFRTDTLCYATEVPLAMAGNGLDWLRAQLGELPEPGSLVPSDAVAVEDSVYFLPALAGLLAPYWQPGARATIHGLALSTTRADLALALLEAVAFSCRQAIELAGQADPAGVRLDGGLTNHAGLMAIQATVLGCRLHVACEAEATALGAAIAAHHGLTGRLPAVEHRLRPVEPAWALTAYYDRKYRHWLGLMDAQYRP